MLWGAYQFGQWGKLTQSAYAYNAELGYHATQWPWQPWLGAAYTVGSGSGNPDSGTHGTFFPGAAHALVFRQFRLLRHGEHH